MMKGLLRFFPVQLLILHFRKSHVLLLFWLTLFGFITESIASRYGIPYLLLAPEYLFKVSFWSFLITGICFGLFVMSFHISSYIYYSRKFQFLSTLQRPIYQFSINNSVIPAVFLFVYIYLSLKFQIIDEGIAIRQAILNITGFVLGMVSIISLIFTYFFSINKNIISSLGGAIKPLGEIIGSNDKGEDEYTHVQTYLYHFTKIKYVRGVAHYESSFIDRILDKQFRSASYYFAAVVFLIIALGLFREDPRFLIPAGASSFILISIYILFVAVIYSWFPRWYISALILALLGFNYVWKLDLNSKMNCAYGLSYDLGAVEYSNQKLFELSHPDSMAMDLQLHELVLDSWKRKTAKSKPYMVVVNASGGGMRSVLFTTKVLNRADLYTDGAFYNQLELITGASGGMIGATFYDGLKRRKLHHDSISKLIPGISKDLLNPVVFTLITNDLFVNTLKYEAYGQRYNKDRGYAFEKFLSKNSEGVLDGRLNESAISQIKGESPMLIYAPSIVNDGRKLLFSPLPITFLTSEKGVPTHTSDIDGVEFNELFKDLGAERIELTNVLRMNASFPYITPMVQLPTNPELELIDAGARDNTGSELSSRYLLKLKSWINENTSGIILVSIRSDEISEIEISESQNQSFLENIFSPVGGVYMSYDNMQEFNESKDLKTLSESIEVPIEHIEFRLFEKQEAVSLSWHLTQKEKQLVDDVLYSEHNRRSFRKLQSLLAE